MKTRPRPATSPGSPASEHESRARTAVRDLRAAVITASDTRTRTDDRSGDLLAAGLAEAGIALVDRRLVRDEISALTAAVQAALAGGADVVIVTGGTGVAPRDVTPEALQALGVRELPGYGEVFRARGYDLVGAPALFSRAMGGTLGQAVVFALPGSPDACAMALPLLLSGLHHLVHQLRGGRAAAAGRGHQVP